MIRLLTTAQAAISFGIMANNDTKAAEVYNRAYAGGIANGYGEKWAHENALNAVAMLADVRSTPADCEDEYPAGFNGASQSEIGRDEWERELSRDARNW